MLCLSVKQIIQMFTPGGTIVNMNQLDVSVNAQRLQKSAPARECYFAIKKKRMSCPHVPNGQLSCLLHIYILSRIQWTWFGMIQSGSVCSMMFTKSKTQKKQQLCTRGQVKMYPMGNKGVCCTSTCWDKNNELHLEWFRAIVFNLHCLQSPKRKKKQQFCARGQVKMYPMSK